MTLLKIGRTVYLHAAYFVCGALVAAGCLPQPKPGCISGETLCGDKCVETTSDKSHCGECDNACAGNNVCSSSKCVAECGQSLTNCSGSCVDTTSAKAHCGKCDEPCSTGDLNGSAVCVESQCKVVCKDGFDLCGGACVNTKTDNDHCGRCDKPCALRNCKNGSCGVVNVP